MPSLPGQVQAGQLGAAQPSYRFIYIRAALKDDPGAAATHHSCNRIPGKRTVVPLRALAILIRAGGH